MKTTLKSALIMAAIALLIGGCGGSASAPPVDLPAPITGYIDVSAPDGNGDVTISGGEGSVTGDSIVLVVNESESASIFRPVIDALVRSALAEDGFPEICSMVGHACTMSNSNGEFVLVIKADYGDLLTIGIINSLGEWISELSQMSVPSEPEANCAGLGLSGKVVDVVLVPNDGTPILLKQGSDTTTNTLVIGKTAPFTEVKIDGCYAHSIAAYPSSSDSAMIAVTSRDDRVIWRGTYQGGAISSPKSFEFTDFPMHIAFADSQYQPVVAFLKGTSLVLARVSLLGGGIAKESAALSENPTRSLRVAMQEVDGWLGLVLADKGDGTDFVLAFFDAVSLVIGAKTFTKTQLGVPTIYDAGFWVSALDNVNLAFVGNYDSNGRAMKAGMTDSSGLSSITTSSKPSDVSNVGKLVFAQLKMEQGELKSLAVSYTSITSIYPYAPTIVSTGFGGWICLASLEYLSDLSAMGCTEAASGQDIAAISLTDDPQYAFVANATGGSVVDVSGILWPPAP